MIVLLYKLINALFFVMLFSWGHQQKTVAATPDFPKERLIFSFRYTFGIPKKKPSYATTMASWEGAGSRPKF